ncbi:hypothetical protein DIPPA_09301 [Diplonema papillatum]|nr:hypothetical protein DIPPA_09301 [Diplonema papillatum]
MRPIFRGGTETMEVLETQLTTARHGFNGEAWGMDLFPTYGGGRAERAARWAVFNDATEKKGKKSVAWCCKAHHKEDDGLAVKFCAAPPDAMRDVQDDRGVLPQRTHRCLDHGMPTCAHCSRLADLRSRRPKLCCRKGHHRAAVARAEESTTKKRKAEPEGPAPAPRQAKRENVVLVLPEAAEGEQEPATSTPTSAAKVGKTAPTPAKKRQSDSRRSRYRKDAKDASMRHDHRPGAEKKQKSTRNR